MKHLSLLSILLLVYSLSYSQSDSTKKETKGEFDYTFYIDSYYSFDFNEPNNHNRPGFLLQYNRHRQVGINYAMAEVNYTKDKLSTNLGLSLGGFAQVNMANERDLFRMLYRANIGYEILKDLELTIGIFGSHMGFESTLSYDNLLVSHSLTTEWTAYYLAGLKLEYTLSDKWFVGATLANGNQKITEVEGNTNKLLGLQLTYTPTKKVNLNYSNLYYNDEPDSSAIFIFYNNLYSTFELGKKLDMVLGFDFAFSDNKVTNKQDMLYAISVLAKYKLTDKFAVAGRYEYYNDERKMYIKTDVLNPFVTSNYSLALDYSPIKQVKFRVESRLFSAEKPVYRDDSDFNPNTSTTIKYTTQNANILVSVQAKF
jgi:hypothetical protein|tara:strand:+ start:182 stop:1291 length:1110 start_codon:yes stop_codon:yes gene_type:complete